MPALTRTSSLAALPDPTVSNSKVEAVYAVIKERIVAGEYSPGSRLVLDQLARELSTSTVPIREALRRLEARGYVEFERNVGARVARLDPREYVPTMNLLALLEGYATAVAAPNLRPIGVARARRINSRMRLAPDDFDPLRFTGLNRDFHFFIYKACPDRHLRGLLEAEWTRLDSMRRSSFVYVPDRARASITEHEALLDLIASGADAAAIEQAARNHKLRTLEALLAATNAPPLHRPGALARSR